MANHNLLFMHFYLQNNGLVCHVSPCWHIHGFHKPDTVGLNSYEDVFYIAMGSH